MMPVVPLGRAWPLLSEAVAFHAQGRHDAPAVSDGENAVSYSDLWGQATAVASGLRHRNVERVGALLGNSVNHLALLIAGPLAGCTVAPLNTSWAEHRIRSAAASFDLDFLVLPRGGHPRPDWPVDSGWLSATMEAVEEEGRSCRDESSVGSTVDAESWHLIATTGGTSGGLKGVAISHRATSARALAQNVIFGATPESSFLVTTPMFHGAARGAAFAHLMAGATVMLRSGFDPLRFAADSADATSTFCVPTMLVQLLDAGVANLRPDLMILVSGAALPAEIARQAKAQLGCRIVNYYASVEAGGLAAKELTAPEASNGSPIVGFPFFGTELQVVDAGGEPAVNGSVGHITARSASLASAVIGDDGAIQLVGEKLAMQDLGYFDQAGQLVLAGRSDDVVISGGVNVFPAQVEENLRRHPDVKDALVVGLPDRTWGQIVGALVVLGDLSLDCFQDWADQELASAERPRRVAVVDELPFTLLGKPDRQQATSLLAGD